MTRSKYTKESDIISTTNTNGTNTNGTSNNKSVQDVLMETDMVLVLDSTDTIIGYESKYTSHIFNSQQSHGILHRAFSIFLFDIETKQLLVHKRSSDKITFPNVWTNTCCSHPLNGMIPSETDTTIDKYSNVPIGIKNAIIRKLTQELGIPANQIIDQPKLVKMKYLTRLHYWAADTITHGPNSPWGEHEIDYVVFMSIHNKSVLTIQPNPNEIDEIKWVTKTDLNNMLNDQSLLFSPWFRIIYNTWIQPLWWENDIQITINTNKHVNHTTIHQFDPPIEHYGGAGNAKPLFIQSSSTSTSTAGNNTLTIKKQGAYGKIKTHTESKLTQLLHYDEVVAAIQLLYIQPLRSNVTDTYIKERYTQIDLDFCNMILVKVSRSFAAVIQQLPKELLVDIIIFYLILRGLDTIEDDMDIFDPCDKNKQKIIELHTFHEKLNNKNWCWIQNIGFGYERLLLQKFYHVIRIYQQLSTQSQIVISDITKRMAYGMAEYVSCNLGQGTETIKDYNMYCHYVAGLVGEGLTRLFVISGLEPQLSIETNSNIITVADQMGLFLQKTNIIRDYLEDYVDQRTFWPQEIWKKYSVTNDIGYFAIDITNAVDNKKLQYNNCLYCINELVTDALEIIPDCLLYMSKLQQKEIFRFCAIPQVMAIATLEKCYYNTNVFTGVVKIRKGLSCKLINQCTNLYNVYTIFNTFILKIKQRAIIEKNKNGHNDPNYDRTITICNKVCVLIRTYQQQQEQDKQKQKQLLGGTSSMSKDIVPQGQQQQQKSISSVRSLLYRVSYPILGIGIFWPYLSQSTITSFIGMVGNSSLSSSSSTTNNSNATTTTIRMTKESTKDILVRTGGLILSAIALYWLRPINK